MMDFKDPDLPFGLVLFVVFGVLGSLVLLSTQKHRETLPMQIKVFATAFALRFISSIAIYQFGLVAVLGDEDSSGWVVGATLRQTWLRQGVGIFELPSVLGGAYSGGHHGYYYLLGLLFYITGSPARMPAAALNCFCGALAVVFAYRIARTLFSDWVAVRVGWWTCFLPSMIVWSAQTLKEPVVILLEVLALYACVHLRKSGFSLRYILLCAAVVILIIPFRFYAAYIIGATILLTLLVPQLSKRKIAIVPLIAVALLVAGFLFGSGQLLQQETQLESFDLQRVQDFKRDVASTGNSGVEAKFDLKTTSGMIGAIAFGGVHLLLAPFPWQWGGASLRMLFVLPEVVLWWWLFFMGLVPGFWHSVRRRFGDILPLLIFLFGFGFLYSLMFGNVGLVYRQRAQLLPWLLMLAAYGLELRRQKRQAAARPYSGPETALSLKGDPVARAIPGS